MLSSWLLSGPAVPDVCFLDWVPTCFFSNSGGWRILSNQHRCHGNPQVVTKIAASLFAGALLFDVMLGISMWTSVCLGHVCAWLGRHGTFQFLRM